MIYLDNAATTKVSQEVIDAMLPYMSLDYGNPGSIHSMGRLAANAIEKARKQVAKPINADPECIIFTSGGSEANTLAIVGLADYLRRVGKTHIITSTVEHQSVLEPIKYLFDNGFDVTHIPVDSNGYVSPDDVDNAIHGGTGLVSIMGINNEIGNKMDTKSIGQICRANDVLFHTDCVQAYCDTEIDVDKFCIDFLSASGHKFHAQKGIGFLYARNKDLLNPIIFGGKQEFGIRAGTENVPAIIGMGAAAEGVYRECHKTPEHYKTIKEEFFNILSELQGVYINGDPCKDSKIVNVRFDGVDGETLLLLLGSKGVVVSAGSACTAHLAVPSHVLTAIGLSSDQARSSIRISFSKYTTLEEVRDAARVVVESVKNLRRR